jgi:hypothetical protein
LEASAKTGDNITQIFEKIGYQVLENEGAGDKQKENEGKMIEKELGGIHLEKPLDFVSHPEQKTDGTATQAQKKSCCG